MSTNNNNNNNHQNDRAAPIGEGPEQGANGHNYSTWDSPGEEIELHSAERMGELTVLGDFPDSDHADFLYAKMRQYSLACSLDTESKALIEELTYKRADPSKFPKYIQTLEKLRQKQEQQLGKNHDSIAHTEMMIGICQERARELDAAVKTLRRAVVRFQQSDDTDTALFVECLCRTADIYRINNKLEAARTCIKQGYQILPFCDGQPFTHCRILEALAALLFSERRYRASAKAYVKLIEIKKRISKLGNADICKNLIELSMCYFTVHDLENAELALVEACHVYYDSACDDKYLNVELLDKMTGVLRHKGLLLQADLLSERSHELIVNSSRASAHAVYGNLLNDAMVAEAAGDSDLAKERYREALAALEPQREKRLADRVPILARIYFMTTPKQLMQRTTLLSDMQDSVQNFFHGLDVTLIEGLSQLSLLYRLLGKSVAADDLLRLSQECANNENANTPRLGHIRELPGAASNLIDT